MGRAANLQSAAAVSAAGYLSHFSICAVDLAVDRRADHGLDARALAGLAATEADPSGVDHRRRGLGVVQGRQGAVGGGREDTHGVRCPARRARQDIAQRNAGWLDCVGRRVGAEQPRRVDPALALIPAAQLAIACCVGLAVAGLRSEVRSMSPSGLSMLVAVARPARLVAGGD